MQFLGTMGLTLGKLIHKCIKFIISDFEFRFEISSKISFSYNKCSAWQGGGWLAGHSEKETQFSIPPEQFGIRVKNKKRRGK